MRNGGPMTLELMRFAFNCRQPDQMRQPNGAPGCRGDSDQAFEAAFRAAAEGHTLEQATVTGTSLRPTWPWG